MTTNLGKRHEMKAKQLAGQQSLNLFDLPMHDPRNCPHELTTVDIGGGKSFCAIWDRWTNCREVGYCVYAKYADG